MRGLIEIPVRYPVVTLLLIMALTALAVCGVVDPVTGTARLRIDPSTEGLLPRDDEAYAKEQPAYEHGPDEGVARSAASESLDIEQPEAAHNYETEHGRDHCREHDLEDPHVAQIELVHQVLRVAKASALEGETEAKAHEERSEEPELVAEKWSEGKCHDHCLLRNHAEA